VPDRFIGLGVAAVRFKLFVENHFCRPDVFSDSYVPLRVRKSRVRMAWGKGGVDAGVLQELGMREFCIYFRGL
jgi:hypothetical protein